MIKSKKLINYKILNHCFFNKKGGVSKGIYWSLNCGKGSNDKKENINKNIKIVSKKIGCNKKNLVFLHQIHSNKFFFINKSTSRKLKGDGLITNKKNIALCILTADCAPIFIYDPVKQIIAAVHAGWKGAYKKIALKVLKKIIRLGSEKKNIISVIGPCISKNSYEVKNDFKRKFIIQNKNNIKYFKFIKSKIYFSLSDYLKGQLMDFGIKNIDVIKKDTFKKKNNFFSSRSSLKNLENDYGRNISVIMIK